MVFSNHCWRVFLPLLHPASRLSIQRQCFKSAYSLDKVYPHSQLSDKDPVKPPDSADENTFSGYIPMDQLTLTYSQSGGPGGQNVNRVNTRVQLRFHLDSAKWLSEAAKLAVKQKFPTRLTKDGELLLTSDRTRSQHLNRADAMDRLRFLITESLRRPKPVSDEAVERQRRLREKAARERLLEKRSSSMRRREKDAGLY